MSARRAENEEPCQNEGGEKPDRKGEDDRDFERYESTEHHAAHDVGKCRDPAGKYEDDELPAQLDFSPTTKNCLPMMRQAGGHLRYNETSAGFAGVRLFIV